VAGDAGRTRDFPGSSVETFHIALPVHLGHAHRADIYALGVVFYQMLTGELPGKHLQPPSRKVQVDVRLDEIVLHAVIFTAKQEWPISGKTRRQSFR
jgi:hypothetical protein